MSRRLSYASVFAGNEMARLKVKKLIKRDKVMTSTYE